MEVRSTPPSRAMRMAFGKARRAEVPRSSHGVWQPPAQRADPLELLQAAAAGRVPELAALREERMAASPFAFLRGANAIMTADLATTSTTGITVQLCGDAHCANFGGVATDDGNVTFEVVDFDETLAGPWEWDVKRLVTSIVALARSNGSRMAAAEEAAAAGATAYRLQMAHAAEQTVLETWAERIDASELVKMTRATTRKRRPASVAHRYFKLTELDVDGERRFVDEPPLVYHTAPDDPQSPPNVELMLLHYRDGVREEVQALLDRYRFVDWVAKVVGIGSVGMRCGAALLMADEDDPLILQVKEAVPSVLERYLGASRYPRHGARVVAGQRLLQSAADPFLGYTSAGGHDYYVRRLRAQRGSPELTALDADQLRTYAAICGRTLAAAHARGGDAATIAGYLGDGDAFDEALVRFATTYAEQNERDFALFIAARTRSLNGAAVAGP